MVIGSENDRGTTNLESSQLGRDSIALMPKMGVGIHTETPYYDLDVNGVIHTSSHIELTKHKTLSRTRVESAQLQITAASVNPTYAWEFRDATGTAVVYDLVNGVAATPLNGAMKVFYA